MRLFSEMGKADQLVSDGGPAFKADALENFLKYFNLTSQLMTHPHQPTAHGMVERVNEETRKHLQLLLNKYEFYSYDEWMLLKGSFYRWCCTVEFMHVTISNGLSTIALNLSIDEFNQVSALARKCIDATSSFLS